MRQLNFGLPISIDEKNGEVRLGKDILCESAAAKNFSGIKHLAYNEGEADDNEHCYTFYQNIWTSQDAPVFQQRQMTNGITVLMPGLMGYECRKNSGHYHGLPQGHTSTLPEVYEVLCGKAVFLMQQSHGFLDERGPLQVERLRAFFLHEGEKVVVPSFTAHCVINVGEGPMAFGNLSVPCPLHYEPIGRMHGFGMYLLKVDGQLVFVPNSRYKDLPQLEIGRPRECGKLGIQFNKPLYTAYKEDPEQFEYLWNPEPYGDAIDTLYEG